MTREIADRFRNTKMEHFLPDLEKMLGRVDLTSPSGAGKQSTSFSDYFKKIREGLKAEESKPPEYELHRLPTKTGSDDIRYAVISDNAWNFGNIQNHLTTQHPALAEASWHNPCVTVKKGSAAEKLLDTLVVTPERATQPAPTNSIESFERVGTAMECALTAKQMVQGGKR